MVNGLADLFPLLVFLNVDPWSEWCGRMHTSESDRRRKRYNEHVVRRSKKNATQATERAQIILNPVLLCVHLRARAKTDTLQPPDEADYLGRQAAHRLADQDDQHASARYVAASSIALTPKDFSRDERELYNAIEAGIQAKVPVPP